MVLLRQAWNTRVRILSVADDHVFSIQVMLLPTNIRLKVYSKPAYRVRRATAVMEPDRGPTLVPSPTSATLLGGNRPVRASVGNSASSSEHNGCRYSQAAIEGLGLQLPLAGFRKSRFVTH